MKKRCIAIILINLVLLGLFPLTSHARPTNAQIDFQARNNFGAHIAPCAGKLYYFEGQSLYSMSTNGVNQTRIFTLPDADEIDNVAESLQVYNGSLYFEYVDYAIYKYTPGNKRPVKLLENALNPVIGGDVLYYGVPSGKYIKALNLKTNKKSTVLTSYDYTITPDNFLEKVLVFKISGNSAASFGFYNPTTKITKTMNSSAYSPCLQTRGSYLYEFNDHDKKIYKYAFDPDKVTLGSRVTVSSQSGWGFITGDYMYYAHDFMKNGEEWITWYKRHLGTEKTTAVFSVFSGGQYTPDWLEPCGDYVWRFAWWDGVLKYQGRYGK